MQRHLCAFLLLIFLTVSELALGTEMPARSLVLGGGQGWGQATHS